MKQTFEGYVNKCSHGVLPSGTVDAFIEMEVVLLDTHTSEKTFFTMCIKDPNWTNSTPDSLLTYRKYKINVLEKEKYTLYKTVCDKHGNERCLTDVEKEMAFDLIFDCCGEEMTYYREKQEKKMMRSYGMSEEEYDALSDKELEELDRPYIRTE